LHILLARKIGKWTLGNRRPVGPFRRERLRERVLAGGSYSPAEADKTPPLKRMRGGARVCTKFPCNDRSEERSSTGRDGLYAVNGWPAGLHQRLLTSCRLFSKCAAPFGGGTRIRRLRRRRPCAALTIALLRLVPRRAPPKPYRDAGRARRTPRLAGLQQSARTIPLGMNSRRRPAHGCGTHLIHCGGQTDRRFAAEMQ
jgi:hypothetical protein